MKMQLIVGAIALFVASGAFAANPTIVPVTPINPSPSQFQLKKPLTPNGGPFYYCSATGVLSRTGLQVSAVDPGPYYYILNHSYPPNRSPLRRDGSGHCEYLA